MLSWPGVLLRVAFFAGAVMAGEIVFQSLILVGFGVVVASTIGLFAVAILANLVAIRIFDRQPLSHIGLGGNPGTGRNFLLGVLIGGFGAMLLLLPPLISGTAHMSARAHGSFRWSSLIFYLACLLFGAAAEEMIFRGYAFQVLVQKMGAFATILPVSVLFALGHFWNPNVSVLGVVNTMLWGVLLGYAFVRSRDLWLPIGMHYGWNAMLPLFGANLSGLTIDVTRYSYKWDLAALWSGGTYGPEGGLLTTILVIVLFFTVHRAPVVPQQAFIATNLN